MARKYDNADFNIQPFHVKDVVDQMREMGLLSWGSVISVEMMYTLVEVPYLSPSYVGKRSRFDRIRSQYHKRKRVLRTHLLQVEAKALEWIERDALYMVVVPEKLVDLKASRFRRTLAANSVNVQDTLQVMKNYMDASTRHRAETLLNQVEQIERLIRKPD